MPLVRTPPEAQELLNELESLAKDGYIFRGHRDSLWKLEPYAFRHPLASSNELEKALFLSTFLRNDPDLKNETSVLYWIGGGNLGRGRIIRESLIQLIRFLMNYGEKIALFHQRNPDVHTASQEMLLKGRTPEFWTDLERTFPYFLQSYNEAYTEITFDGKTQRLGVINNILCAFDETFPQHYYDKSILKEGTTLLDWTDSPIIPFYFAINDKEDQTPFSIFAFKPYHVEGSGIRIIDGNPAINARLNAQKGRFTRFEKAPEELIKDGKWPTMETYYNIHTDPYENQLKKYTISANMVDFFRNVLIKHNINAKTLCLADAAKEAEPTT